MKGIIEAINQENLKNSVPSFNVGDTVKVSVKVIEGTRERIQAFEGICIAKNGGGILLWSRSVANIRGGNVKSNKATKGSGGGIFAQGGAHVNLVVSASGLGTARALQEMFGTPYVVGVPMGSEFSTQLRAALQTAVATGDSQFPRSSLSDGGGILIIGEAVNALSLSSALELSTGRSTRVICPTECGSDFLRSKDLRLQSEEEIEQAISGAEIVIADPLFRPICPETVRFVDLPTEAFSGRIYRRQIPNLVSGFHSFASEVCK